MSQTSSGWLSRNVLALGLVSLLTDTASEMVLPLLPAFLASLGAGALTLGWIEGLADLVASVLKLIAGRWSDRAGRRRWFVLFGYGLSSFVRPCLALATSAWHVLGIRALDRVGKGFRGSPRDALLAESVPAAARGRAFGFHRAMDHAGATLGPLLAIALLYCAELELRTLFLCAAVPGLLSVVVILAGVREARSEIHSESTFPPPEQSPTVRIDSLAPPPSQRRHATLLSFLAPLALFTLSKSSDLFLMQLLLDQELLVESSKQAPSSLIQFSLAWIGMHILKTVAAYPGGALSDRFGRQRLILLGWLLHALACFALAFASSWLTLCAAIALWSLQDGLTEAPQKSELARLAVKRTQGTAFGFYHLTIGLFSLAASVLFGSLYQSFGARSAFLTSAGIALAASFLLTWVAQRRTA